VNNSQLKKNTMNQSIKAMYKKMSKNEIGVQIWWDYIATQDKNEVHQVIETMGKVERRLKSFLNGFHHTTKIRPFCNEHGWSDVEPYEVVRVISANCVEVREMIAEQIVFPKEFHVGGFAAHCADNYNQSYKYTSDPSRPTIKIRKGKKGWANGKFRMSNGPIKFYDYNF
jgi:hypothetical protein